MESLTVFLFLISAAATYCSALPLNIEQKVVVNGGSNTDYLGTSVGISGDFAIVSAYVADNNGIAYIYQRDSIDGTWTQAQRLESSTDGDIYSTIVAISGDYAIVGYINEGKKAYIFERDPVTNFWSEAATLTASTNGYGRRVDISGDRAIVGALKFHGATYGNAYIYERNPDGTWFEAQKLTAGDPRFYDRFGVGVAISGDYALIGASHNDDDGGNRGSTYIFQRDNSDGSWTQVQKLLNTDGVGLDYFGTSVALDGDFGIVGAPGQDIGGSAYIFEKDSDGNFFEIQRLTASDSSSGDDFGASVSISGNYVVVGAYRDKDTDTFKKSGAVYVFERDSSTGVWSQIQKLKASDPKQDGIFGITVSIDKDSVAVGAGNQVKGSYLFGPGPKYVGVDTPMTYQEAEEYCQDTYGTSLATIKSEEDNTLFREIAEDAGAFDALLWTGLNDLDDDSEFEWNDGSALDYKNFYHFGRSFPAGPQKKCIAMNSDRNDKWVPRICDTDFNFVCNGPDGVYA